MSQNKKEIALNTHLFFWLAILIAFICLTVWSIIDDSIGIAIGFGIVCFVYILVFLISPIYFTFSDVAIEIVYTLGMKEYIEIDTIRSITSEGSWGAPGGGTPHFHLAYPRTKKLPFFMCGDISKTRKTKKLMSKYCKKKIT